MRSSLHVVAAWMLGVGLLVSQLLVLRGQGWQAARLAALEEKPDARSNTPR